MNQFEAADEIATAIPECKNEISEVIKSRSAYAIIKVLARHIRYFVATNNQAVYEKSVRLVDKIYQKGDSSLKAAIENILVFSLDSIMSPCAATQKRAYMSKIPSGLYTLYVRQIYRSGI